MKKNLLKSVSLVLAVLLCVSLVGCGKTEGNEQDGGEQQAVQSEITEQKTYTYIVTPMQGVGTCVYYGPDDYVPNSPDPEAARNKIHVYTKCITCGDDCNQKTIEVDKLDFSSGDKITYTNTDSCWDCSWERQIESFMWAISIERKEVK